MVLFILFIIAYFTTRKEYLVIGRTLGVTMTAFVVIACLWRCLPRRLPSPPATYDAHSRPATYDAHIRESPMHETAV